MDEREEEHLIPLDEYKEELKVTAVTVKKRYCPLCNLQLGAGEPVVRVQIVYFVHPACIGYKKLSYLYKQIEYEKKRHDLMRERAHEMFNNVLEELRHKGVSEDRIDDLENIWGNEIGP